MYILSCSLQCDNNIFHLTWKNSQKIHEATYNFINEVPLRATSQYTAPSQK